MKTDEVKFYEISRMRKRMNLKGTEEQDDENVKNKHFSFTDS